MNKLDVRHICVDCGGTHRFPENIVRHWNHPEAHTCTGRKAFTPMQGIVYGLSPSICAELGDLEEPDCSIHFRKGPVLHSRQCPPRTDVSSASKAA
jgi:hypothetical protein